MKKSIFTAEYRVLRSLLRKLREDAGVTQEDMARRLKITQSNVSKFERGETRLDIVQLRQWCRVLGIGLPEFSVKFEDALQKKR